MWIRKGPRELTLLELREGRCAVDDRILWPQGGVMEEPPHRR